MYADDTVLFAAVLLISVDNNNMKMTMSLLPPSESLVAAGARSSYVGGVASLTIQNASRCDEGVCSQGRAEGSAGVQVKGQINQPFCLINKGSHFHDTTGSQTSSVINVFLLLKQ